MSYHSVELMLAAYGQWHRAVEDAKRPNALTTMDSLGAVVMAAAASEGFINELAEIPDGGQKEKTKPRC
jgi:hypothetical protein